MQPLNVVLLQSDPGTSHALIAPLRQMFHSVREALSLGDLRTSLAKHRAEVVILDLEAASVPELKNLSHEFPEVSIVCNHRLADEQMWTATLSAGAADCCPSYDTRGILRAAMQKQTPSRMAA